MKDSKKMTVKLLHWGMDHKADLIRICNGVDRSYLSDRMPYPYTEKDADWWLEMVREHDGVDGLFRAVAVDGSIVGSISLEQKSDVYRVDAAIGYMLLSEYWSKGIMTEAVRMICDEGFEKLDITRISGIAYAPNIASQRVLLKNGFIRECLQKDAAIKAGRLYDICLFGKTKAQ